MASVLNRRSFLITAAPALALLSGLGADKVQAESIDVCDIFICELEKTINAS